MDPGGLSSLRRLALLLVLPSRGDQGQAPVRPETRQAQVGRLPGQARPPVHRLPHQDRGVVRWEASLHACQEETNPGRTVRSALFPGPRGPVRVSSSASRGQGLTSLTVRTSRVRRSIQTSHSVICDSKSPSVLISIVFRIATPDKLQHSHFVCYLN